MPVKLLDSDTIEIAGPYGEAYIRHEGPGFYAVDAFGPESDNPDAHIDSDNFPTLHEAWEWAKACAGDTEVACPVEELPCMT